MFNIILLPGLGKMLYRRVFYMFLSGGWEKIDICTTCCATAFYFQNRGISLQPIHIGGETSGKSITINHNPFRLWLNLVFRTPFLLTCKFQKRLHHFPAGEAGGKKEMINVPRVLISKQLQHQERYVNRWYQKPMIEELTNLCINNSLCLVIYHHPKKF